MLFHGCESEAGTEAGCGTVPFFYWALARKPSPPFVSPRPDLTLELEQAPQADTAPGASPQMFSTLPHSMPHSSHTCQSRAELMV